ncbi:MAG: phage holin family protein [Solirubrobacterales bacterium]|nr:phage holin family protein [Solirubrobacterales bacterium]
MADNPYSHSGGDNQPPPAAIAQAIADISEKTSLLIREEIELAKAEVEVKLKSLVKGAAIGIAGGLFFVVALYFTLHGLAWLAWYELFPNDQFFWGFFVVAGVLFVVGGLAGFFAAKLVKAGSSPAPTMAIREAQLIKDTVTNPQPEKR